MEGVVGEDELGALGFGEAVGDEIDVEVFVGAVNLVADDGVADVGEVDADLMFAAGMRLDFEEAEGGVVVGEGAKEFPTGFGRESVFDDVVFDGDVAVEIAAERGGNFSGGFSGMVVDDRKVGFLDGFGFPCAADGAGGGVFFGEEDEAGGFAIEAIDEMVIGLEVKADAADEAGGFIAFGGMDDEAGGFVENENLVVFVDDVEEFGHFAD